MNADNTTGSLNARGYPPSMVFFDEMGYYFGRRLA